VAAPAETRASGPAILHVDVRPDRIAVVTLEDPSASANVVTGAFLSELRGVLDRLRTDSGLAGAVLVSGKAESFVVGCDVARLQGFTLARDAEAAARAFAGLLAGLSELGKPLVAAVHGPALGAGFELALACDQIVATDEACTAFGLPEARLGLLPAGNGLLRVAERAGVRVALELGLGGERKDAVTAKRLGLVDEVCPKGVLLEVAATRAKATMRARRPFARRAFDDNAIARRLVVSPARADVHTRRGGP
jgi:3-hydroxyacyl-CoA dehydrogenase/enoyl-CoA hydratase/3-hydroxybutyryl-CoA epimerase